MPRKRVSKDIHTKPSLAGADNLPAEFIKKAKDPESDGLLGRIIPTFENGLRNKRKTAWSEEELSQAIHDYFNYCNDNDLKPSKAGLRLYLGVSRSQYYSWQTETGKYGYVSDLINMANDLMEIQYINRSESFPTANLFLLRTSHGHVESSKVDISTESKASSDDIKDVVSKLGLDKPKSE